MPIPLSGGPFLSLDPVIAALAAAPSLTRLALATTEALDALPVHCSGLRGAFAALHELDLQLTCTTELPNLAAQLWPLPLTPLHVQFVHVQIWTRGKTRKRDCAGRVVDIFPTLAGHPNLTHLHLEVGVHGTAARALDGLDAGLQHLRHCNVSKLNLGLSCVSDFHWQSHTARALGVGIAHMTALKELKLCVPEDCGSASPPAGEGLLTGRAGEELLVQEGQQMKDMNIYFDASGSEDASSAYHFPLALFLHLTRLDMRFRHGCQVRYLRQQLPLLTRLECLTLHHVRCNGARSLEATLGPLTRLTRLVVEIQECECALVRCLGRCASRMPGLDTLELHTCVWFRKDSPDGSMGSADDDHFGGDDHSADDDDYSDPEPVTEEWVQGLLDLPSWGHYKIVNFLRLGGPDEDEVAAVREKLVARGAQVCKECLDIKF